MLLQQDQRSNEIQHGEIPTFLKGHTALSSPSPLFPLGANRLADVAAGQPAVKPAAAACRVLLLLLLLSLSLSPRLRSRLHWQTGRRR